MRGVNETRKRYQSDTGIDITPHLKLQRLYWTENGIQDELDYIAESIELRDYIEWLENQTDD